MKTKIIITLLTLLFSHTALAGNLSALVGCSGGGVTWAGYTTSAYNGAMGGYDNLHSRCNTEYPGSHACTFDEIMKLGTNYPYTQNAWHIDTQNNYNCSSWNSNSSTNYSFYFSSTGIDTLTSCSSSLKISCCK